MFFYLVEEDLQLKLEQVISSHSNNKDPDLPKSLVEHDKTHLSVRSTKNENPNNEDSDIGKVSIIITNLEN